ncbi:hypothetical protein MMC16_001116 [Acarospora aff. strigata]|nr:hypothetical protein [Acarospora aff. strigata]
MPQPPSRTSSVSSELPGLSHVPRESTQANTHQAGHDVHYTVFIRVPVPRGDFIDPQPVDWNVSKDRALWRYLSKRSKSGEVDCEAEQYNVTLPFLLQQAAWLYEQQLSQVRAQMRKVTTPLPTAPSPVPGSASENTTVGTRGIGRGGSGDAGSRVPSSLSRRSNDSPVPRNERRVAGITSKPTAPKSSHSSSSLAQTSNPRRTVSSLRHPMNYHDREKTAATSDAETQLQSGTTISETNVPRNEQGATSPSAKSDSSSETSTSDSEPAEQISKSQAFKQRPRFTSTKAATQQDADGEDDEGDDDESPAFLPFSNTAPAPSVQDPSATLRIDTPPIPTQNRSQAANQPIRHPWSQTTHSSASSGSSTAPTAAGTHLDVAQTQRAPGPLSPRRAAELSALSPRRRALAREGSDGTPSMGSSFSDLDDTSVTQSALEEALLSNMQHGGVASRMSTISQALRSRYL